MRATIHPKSSRPKSQAKKESQQKSAAVASGSRRDLKLHLDDDYRETAEQDVEETKESIRQDDKYWRSFDFYDEENVKPNGVGETDNKGKTDVWCLEKEDFPPLNAK